MPVKRQPIPLLVHEEDPSDAIFRRSGDLGNFEVFNNQVLFGVYNRKGIKIAGTLQMPEQTTDEDNFAAKVGVILKMGPSAFKDKDGRWFTDEYGDPIDFHVGDWVVARPSNGWSLELAHRGESKYVAVSQLCRLIDDTAVLMRIDDPDMGPDRIY